MNNSLLSLYVSVLVPVLSEWIKHKDLCYLDTAVCNRSLRTRFLETLTGCYISDLIREPDKSFDWLLLRGLRLKAFDLRDSHKVSPRVESVLTRHLHHLHCYSDQVQLLVEHFHLDASILTVSLLSLDALMLKKVGHFITKLHVVHPGDEVIRFVAFCTNLKELTPSYNSYIYPIVDACDLDVIYNCHLTDLVKRQKCECTYLCDLVRTTSEVDDESAVCLGDGKHYRMTSLDLHFQFKETDEDMQLLTPLLTNLTKLELHSQHVKFIAATVRRCLQLTDLSITMFWRNTDVFRPLLQQSTQLRRLKIGCYSRFNQISEYFLDVVPYSCPLLESCKVFGFKVSPDVESALRSNCRYLAEFSVKLEN